MSEKPGPGRNSKDIVAEIVRDHALHDEARTVLPRLEAAAKGCGGQAIKNLLQGLFLVYQAPDLMAVEGGAQIFWTNYARALSDLPAEAIRLAIEDYNKLPTSRFFPKPGEIRDLALRHASKARSAYVIASMAARIAPKGGLPASQMSDAEKAEKAAELKRIASRLAAVPGETMRQRHERVMANRRVGPAPPPPEKDQHQVAEDLRREADQ